MDLQEIVWEGVGWIAVAQDSDKWQPLVKMVENFLTSRGTATFSRRTLLQGITGFAFASKHLWDVIHHFCLSYPFHNDTMSGSLLE